MGIKFTILHADKTYDEVFHHVITRGPHKGEVRGFAWAGMCAVNRDCKIPPVRKYNTALSPDTVSYVGIAEDEPKRLARLDGVKKVSQDFLWLLGSRDAQDDIFRRSPDFFLL